MTRSAIAIVTVVTLLVALFSPADAWREYVAHLPNGNNVGAAHALGHIAWDGGGPVNEFGKAFAAAGYLWTKALCQGDADGDGQTNGEELGDPCCTWRQSDGKPPLVTDVLSHPGDFGSKLNATDLQARTRRCHSSQAASTTPSTANASHATTSGSSRTTDGSDHHAIQPPASPIPTPTTASSSSVGRVSATMALAIALLTLLLVA